MIMSAKKEKWDGREGQAKMEGTDVGAEKTSENDHQSIWE